MRNRKQWRKATVLTLTDFLKARQNKTMAPAANLLIASSSWKEDKEKPRNAGEKAGQILGTVSQMSY